MKIVQTFWSGNTLENPILNKAGWLSAEFHWMSWALSCLQFNKFYDITNLVTDKLGKQVLVEIFKLPYKEVHSELDILNKYSPKLWALAKIYTYSLQKEPFIHADGDIYIWEKFDDNLNTAELIGQNLEIDFEYYYSTIAQIKEHFTYIPEAILENLAQNPIIHSCNTGIVGGRNLEIFKEYTSLSLSFIERNKEFLEKIDLPTFNIAFEQLLYYSIANYRKVPIKYFLKNNDDFDPTYTGFAMFNSVPYKTKFIHALGNFKKNDETCQHLAKRLRKDYPEYYYNILKICQESGITLNNKAYQLPELSPTIHDFTYFEKLKYSNDLLQVGSSIYYYRKDMLIYDEIQILFSLPINQILKQNIIKDDDCEFIEEKETEFNLKLFNINRLSFEINILDKLGMILYDTFESKKSIKKAINQISKYFPSEEIANDFIVFQKLILDRIKEALYQGGLKLVK